MIWYEKDNPCNRKTAKIRNRRIRTVNRYLLIQNHSRKSQNANGKAIHYNTKYSTSLAVKEIHINLTRKYFLPLRLQK